MNTKSLIYAALAGFFLSTSVAQAESDVYLLNSNDSDPAIDAIGVDGDKLTANNTQKETFTHAGVKFVVEPRSSNSFAKFEETDLLDPLLYADDDVSIVNTGN